MKRFFGLVGFAAMIGLTGCGSDSSSSASNLLSGIESVEGIYQKTVYQKNESACSSVGAVDVSSTDYFMVLGNSQYVDAVYVYACESVADCQAKKAKVDANTFIGAVSYSYTLTSGNLEAGFSGIQQTSGFTSLNGSVCTNPESHEITALIKDQKFSLESRIATIAEYPQPADGYCTTDAAQTAMKGVECSQMIILEGTFVQAF